MADNIVLAQILPGIAALRLKKDFDTVIKEAKTRKKEVCPRHTVEEKVALAQGNTEAMILMNMEAFDYSFVAKNDLEMAKKWFNVPRVHATHSGELASTYYYWRTWNDIAYSRYQGNAIVEKATGKSLLLHPPKIKTRRGVRKRRARKRGARKRRWRRQWRRCGWSRGGVGFRLSVGGTRGCCLETY